MNKFAFIVHPMDIEDIHRNYPLSQKIPDVMIEKIGKTLSPIKISHINSIKTPRGETQGYQITIPLTLKQIQTLPEEKLVKKVIKAGNLAKKQGADIIGLGGSFSSLKDIVAILEKHLSIPVTTGQTYTMATIFEGVRKIANLRKKDFKECEVTIIVDESFSARRGAIRYLAREAKYLTLASEDKTLLENLYQEIFQETGTAVHISDNIHASIKRGDIIITGKTEDVLKTGKIKSGSIICDFSQYKNKNSNKIRTDKDIIIVHDSIVKLPGEVDLGLVANSCCASMAELILLALENHLESFSHPQEIQLEKIDIINNIALKNCFDLIGVTNLYKDQIIFGK